MLLALSQNVQHPHLITGEHNCIMSLKRYASLRDSFRKRLGLGQKLQTRKDIHESDLCLLWTDLNNLFQEVREGNSDAIEGFRHLLNTYKDLDRIYPANVWKRFFNIVDHMFGHKRLFPIKTIEDCLKSAMNFKSYTSRQQVKVKEWLFDITGQRSTDNLHMQFTVHKVVSDVRHCNYVNDLVQVLRQYAHSSQWHHLHSRAFSALYYAVDFVSSHVYQYSTGSVKDCLEAAKSFNGFSSRQHDRIVHWLVHGNCSLHEKSKKIALRRAFFDARVEKDATKLVNEIKSSIPSVEDAQNSNDAIAIPNSILRLLFEAISFVVQNQNHFLSDDVHVCYLAIDRVSFSANQRRVLKSRHFEGKQALENLYLANNQLTSEEDIYF